MSKNTCNLSNLKMGKWYKVQGQNCMLTLFKEPNLHSKVIGFLTENQIFMLIQHIEKRSPVHNRNWVFLGSGEQFGYVCFSMQTQFKEVEPGENRGVERNA